MRMTLYETVKSNVTTLQAAERYGLKVGHGGMCKCPFHNDKNPSMKVDKRFHCFGCQADGDVINFTSRLFDLTPKAAALKLAGDFGIHHNPQQIETAIKKPRMISEKEIFKVPKGVKNQPLTGVGINVKSEYYVEVLELLVKKVSLGQCVINEIK